jgi:hypothetical protein
VFSIKNKELMGIVVLERRKDLGAGFKEKIQNLNMVEKEETSDIIQA